MMNQQQRQRLQQQKKALRRLPESETIFQRREDDEDYGIDPSSLLGGHYLPKCKRKQTDSTTTSNDHLLPHRTMTARSLGSGTVPQVPLPVVPEHDGNGCCNNALVSRIPRELLEQPQVSDDAPSLVSVGSAPSLASSSVSSIYTIVSNQQQKEGAFWKQRNLRTALLTGLVLVVAVLYSSRMAWSVSGTYYS